MKELQKRIKDLNRDLAKAKKSTIKLKLSKRIKFWPLHLYRRPLGGLACGWLSLKNQTHSLTWERWEAKISRICPIQFWFRKTLPWAIDSIGRDLSRQWYELKCKYWKKYNVIHVDTLPPTWNDEDQLLAHGMFAVVKRFLEDSELDPYDPELKYDGYASEGLKYEEWATMTKRQNDFQKEISEIWLWWLSYPELEKEAHKAYRYGTGLEAEDKLNQELTKRLLRIVELRENFWC